uniref:Hexosyltransferase n=1 Tax=Halisarca dujardinii TaxID=2583056 RepID=A0AA96S0D5_HALDU|nr:beta-1,3-galactosyltransferase 6-like protein [Halisarca dujardinii]
MLKKGLDKWSLKTLIATSVIILCLTNIILLTTSLAKSCDRLYCKLQAQRVRCQLTSEQQQVVPKPTQPDEDTKCNSTTTTQNPSPASVNVNSTSTTSKGHSERDEEENQQLHRQLEETEVTQVILQVIIFSRPTSYSLRNACRATWMNSYIRNPAVNFKFAIGTGHLDRKSNESLNKEASVHKDVIFFEGHNESYGKQCVEKLILSLNWVSENAKAKYFLKTDDDCYVRIGYILTLLKIRELITNQVFLMGTIAKFLIPQRDGKWAEDNWKLTHFYPPFAYGSGYILPVSLVKRISADNRSSPLRRLRNEDVTLGVWLLPYDLQYVNIKRFQKVDHAICPYDSKQIAFFHYSQSPTFMYKAHECLPP